MKILFVASECVPFCKTGGLADVVGALPKELRKRRHDVRIILPRYKSVRGQEFGIKETGETVLIPLGDRTESADLRVAKTEAGLKVAFINHEGFFGRPGLYRDARGDYPDNGERFIFFSRAVLEACKAIEFRPDVIHCHDWQTGLVPMYLKTLLKADAFFQHTASVLTLHNLAYQGVFPKTLLPAAGFSWNEFTMDQFEYYDQISFLKAGVVYADLLTTVSPTYARQIQSSYEFGRGLEGVLRRRRHELFGILNGLDVDEWDPAKDPFLAEPFDAGSLGGRRDCKTALQKSLKLPQAQDLPVLAMVARLDPQKGVDLLIQILPDLLARSSVQVIVLGQGDAQLQNLLERYEKQYPQAVRVRSDFNEPLAHHIYGGCDLFLMPSRFEPCGLGQMIAMRYGAIPIVADTGGLHDTVTPVRGAPTASQGLAVGAAPTPAGCRGASGTGFLFEPGSAPGFLSAIREALRWYSDKALWAALQRRAMAEDFSWQASAEGYLSVYRRALGRKMPTRSSVKKPS